VATNIFHQIFDLGGKRFGAVQRKVSSSIYLKLLKFTRRLTNKIGVTPKPRSSHCRMRINLTGQVNNAIGLHKGNRKQWNTLSDFLIEGT
jgi:hypothetical protein